MLNQILQVVDLMGKTLDVVSKGNATLNNKINPEQRKEYANYFQEIASSLKKIAEQMRNEQTLDPSEWQKLTEHGNALCDYLVRLKIATEDKANKISDKFKKVFNNNKPSSLNEEELTGLEALAGIMNYYAEIIPLTPLPQPKPYVIPFTRRDVIKFIGGVGSGAAIAIGFDLLKGRSTTTVIPPPSSDIEWTLTSNFGKYSEGKTPILFDAPQRLSNLVSEMTNGKFKIKVEENTSREVRTDKILNEVSKGEIACGFSGIYYEGSRDLYLLYFACAIPFGLNPQEQTTWLLRKENENNSETYVQKLYQQLVPPYNIIPFPLAATGGQMGGWFDRKITTTDDLKGLRMRIPGLGGEILESFEVDTINLRPDEFESQFEQELHPLNAVEWIGPYDDIKILQLDKIKAKNGNLYYHYPGWWEPSTTFDVQVNKDKWDDLGDSYPQYQSIFKTACWQVYIEMLAEYEQKNSQALQEFIQEGGEVIPFPPEILKKAKTETEEFLNRESRNNRKFAEVYKEWNKFRTQIRQWSRASLPYYGDRITIPPLDKEIRDIIDQPFNIK